MIGDLTIEDLQKECGCSDVQLNANIGEYFHNIANCFDFLENYLHKLGLSPAQQTDIYDLAYRRNIQIAMAEALRLWWQRNPLTATFRRLLHILLDLKRGDVAVRVCKYITENVPKHYRPGNQVSSLLAEEQQDKDTSNDNGITNMVPKHDQSGNHDQVSSLLAEEQQDKDTSNDNGITNTVPKHDQPGNQVSSLLAEEQQDKDTSNSNGITNMVPKHDQPVEKVPREKQPDNVPKHKDNRSNNCYIS